MTNDELMTAQDADELREILAEADSDDDSGCFVNMAPPVARRVLATYHALAASQQEVERLRAEQITRAVDALPDGTTLIKTDKLDALRTQLAEKTAECERLKEERADALMRWTEASAQLASAQEDTKRMNVLADDLPFDGIYGVDLHDEAGAMLTNEATDDQVKNAYRAALRCAIDQERVRLESPPIAAALDHAMQGGKE